ncbi:Hydantoinase/oxoprolinase [Gemmata sp. SH-PL17]|uniref:hydantoinase/oxoprolinase family protein n=1 Tax=Gemmata sp. SH-PL17 TaxID=1630693 RepID=UPI00078C7866|nr:hydantoinase/oxoprolinase family protein [Gemmata sp. SH-PL17]AMV29045.1 Hydantoinase/oxoprolinase [Gemmata sp. SH-PL17]
MATSILGLDIGGANLKAATADGRAASVPFPLWKQPDRLPTALVELVSQFPGTDELAVTMTGELCDCFEAKRDGVHAIIAAVRRASGGHPVRVWSTDGAFLNSEEAKQNHMKVAAANWHALATFAGQYVPEGRAILVDVGTTTTDIIPILDGKPVPVGKTDYDRLFSGELVYTGVRRTPVCAILPWLTAAELFATTLDVYVMLGNIPEDPNDRDTADGRPATRKYAAARLARMCGADVETIPTDITDALVQGARDSQLARLRECIADVSGSLKARQVGAALERVAPQWSLTNFLARIGVFRRRVLDRKFAELRAELPPPEDVAYIVSGSGEFLAQQAIDYPHHTSLNDQLGPTVSACAPAYAVAVLAEHRP